MPTKTSASSAPEKPTVFLSYSHQDEDWKKRVVGHLKVLHQEDVLSIWEDRQIATGDDWLPEIQSAMDRAAVALLLISKDFLTSGFIQGTEVPHLLKRRREEGLRVIPLFVHPCAWQAVPWLAAIQGRPKDAKPLSEHRKPRADQILADLALEIQGWLNDGRKEPIREAPNGGAGIKPGVSTPGSPPPTTPSPEGNGGFTACCRH
ncbi:MAG: toll/interleukin-1 receptor domain-containing protein [Thermoanaerobaculia bacterium]